MDLHMHTAEKEKNTPNCPDCKTKLKGLYFMGAILDGYVCPKCKAVVDQHTHKVIGRSF